MTDRSEIRLARRALGAQLARLRKAAGLTQHQLVSRIDGYGRSSVANAETGHQAAHRDFWLRCDVALSTGGVLTAGYDKVRELIQTAELDGADLALDVAFRARTLQPTSGDRTPQTGIGLDVSGRFSDGRTDDGRATLPAAVSASTVGGSPLYPSASRPISGRAITAS